MAMFSTYLLIASSVLSAGSAVASGISRRRYADDVISEGDRLAGDIERRGADDAERVRINVAQTLGSQRAMIASQGVDTTQGTAAALYAESERYGAADIAMVRENALREAYRLRSRVRIEARGQRSQALAEFGGAFGTVASLGADAWGIYERGRTARQGRAVVNYVNRTGNAGFNF